MEDIFRRLRAFMWTYTPEGARNYRGFHLATGPESCSVLVAWLEQLLRTESKITRTIPLTQLRSQTVPPVSGRLPCRFFQKWKLTICPARDELQEMSITSEGDRVNMEITHPKLPELIQGLRDIENGNGDYAMSAKSPSNRVTHQLWFWPCFGKFWAND
jgi:hypothetical protein